VESLGVHSVRGPNAQHLVGVREEKQRRVRTHELSGIPDDQVQELFEVEGSRDRAVDRRKPDEEPRTGVVPRDQEGPLDFGVRRGISSTALTRT
jgi:hypothetical protein